MGTILVKNVIKRKPGFLYYVDGKGNLSCHVQDRPDMSAKLKCHVAEERKRSNLS